MRGICPNCEKETELESVSTVESFEVKGDTIPVEVKYFQCLDCHERFDDPKSEQDPLELVYREYRRRHGMLQPEEIKDFRKKYGLTQNELSLILGWGGATLSRYENGALQDETHEKTLRLVLEPRNLLKLILDSPEALLPDKRERLITELETLEKQSYSWERIMEERFGDYEPSEFSGFKKLDLLKLSNAILFFCKEGIIKTKLNKLLFYSDFKYFKEYSTSITGVRYSRIDFGPAPDKYLLFFATLCENELLTIEEVFFGNDVTGEKYLAAIEPNLSIFSAGELKILATVKEYFKDFTARKISDFSHEESGYQKTRHGYLISYKHASTLKI
jgi:putative zinc finger/helix-turn-helix YgiT family protein